MRGEVHIDTIVFTIKRAKINDLCNYFYNNGFLYVDDNFPNTKKILSQEKKERLNDLNISICKIRENGHIKGTTTTIIFYGLANYRKKEMKEKFDGYLLFLEYCKQNNFLDELTLKEIHIDLDLSIKPSQLQDVNHKGGRGNRKGINKFDKINFEKESYYLNKIDFYKVLYVRHNRALITSEKFKGLYNTIVRKINKGIDPDNWLGYEIGKIPFIKDLNIQFKEHSQRYNSYSEIKDIYKKFKYVNPIERINKIFETFKKLGWKEKNIRTQETNTIMKLNENYPVYYDDKYIYLKKDEFNKFIMFDELQSALKKYNTTISHKQSKSHDLIIYDKAKKEQLNDDLTRFEFKLKYLDLKVDSLKDDIYEKFINELNKYTIKYQEDNSDKIFVFDLKYDSLLKSEIEKYFKF